MIYTITDCYWHSLHIYVLCHLKAFFNANDDQSTYFNVCRYLLVLLICTHMNRRFMFDSQHRDIFYVIVVLICQFKHLKQIIYVDRFSTQIYLK